MMQNLVSAIFLRDLFHGARLGEADADDDVGAAPGHGAERLLALGFLGDFELAVLDPAFLLEALGAGIGRFIEGLVELAAHVEDDGGLEALGLGGTDGSAAGHGGGDGTDRDGQGVKQAFHRFPSAPLILRAIIAQTRAFQT